MGKASGDRLVSATLVGQLPGTGSAWERGPTVADVDEWEVPVRADRSSSRRTHSGQRNLRRAWTVDHGNETYAAGSMSGRRAGRAYGSRPEAFDVECTRRGAVPLDDGSAPRVHTGRRGRRENRLDWRGRGAPMAPWDSDPEDSGRSRCRRWWRTRTCGTSRRRRLHRPRPHPGWLVQRISSSLVRLWFACSGWLGDVPTEALVAGMRRRGLTRSGVTTRTRPGRGTE